MSYAADDESLYPEDYSEPEWLGMKRTAIPFSDGFIDE